MTTVAPLVVRSSATYTGDGYGDGERGCREVIGVEPEAVESERDA